MQIAGAPSKYRFPELGAASERAGALIRDLHGARDVQHLRIQATSGCQSMQQGCVWRKALAAAMILSAARVRDRAEAYDPAHSCRLWRDQRMHRHERRGVLGGSWRARRTRGRSSALVTKAVKGRDTGRELPCTGMNRTRNLARVPTAARARSLTPLHAYRRSSSRSLQPRATSSNPASVTWTHLRTPHDWRLRWYR